MKKTSLSKKELKFLWENLGKLLGTFESTEIDDLNRLMDDFINNQEMKPVLDFLVRTKNLDTLPINASIIVYGCSCLILCKTAALMLGNPILSQSDKSYIRDYIEYGIRKCRIDVSLYCYLEYGDWLW